MVAAAAAVEFQTTKPQALERRAAVGLVYALQLLLLPLPPSLLLVALSLLLPPGPRWQSRWS